MKKMNVTSLTKRQLIEKSSTTVVISMAAAAFILTFSLVTLNFLWGLSEHNRRVISGKSEANHTLSENVDNIEPLQTSFNVFEAGDIKSSDVLDALPSKYDFPALATTMESLAKRSGVELASFSGDDEEQVAVQSETQPTPKEMEFRVTVRGSYKDVQKFIDNLERTTRPIKVVAMEMKGSDESMTVNMNLVTYYQPATSLDVETRTVE